MIHFSVQKLSVFDDSAPMRDFFPAYKMLYKSLKASHEGGCKSPAEITHLH